MPRLYLPLSTDFALLGLLWWQPLGALEIYQQLSQPTGLGLAWSVKQKQLYSLLIRLERDGYVTTMLKPQNGQAKMYQLTEIGAELFLDWVRRPVCSGRELRLDFLVKLYFAQLEGPEVARWLIEEQRLVCWGWLTEQQREAQRTQNDHQFAWLVHKFRIGQINAMLTWLDSCQKTLPVTATDLFAQPLNV